MTSPFRTLSISALLLVAVAARATVLDFADVTPISSAGGFNQYGTTFDLDGYTFVDQGLDFPGSGFTALNSTHPSYPGETMIGGNGMSRLSFSRTDGGLFDLNQLDYAIPAGGTNPDSTSAFVAFVGTKWDGSIVSLAFGTSDKNIHTASFSDFKGLTKVTWGFGYGDVPDFRHTMNAAIVGNLSVNPAPGPAALLPFVLGAASMVRRRRKG